MQNTSTPFPQGWDITTQGSDSFAMEQRDPAVLDDDGDPAFYISGKVDSTGRLRFGIRTKWQGKRSSLSGQALFQILVDHFRGEGVPIIILEANWNIGELADNLHSFNNAVSQGKSNEESALKETFTGKMAERILHLTKVSFPPPGPTGSAGSYVRIVVEFS